MGFRKKLVGVLLRLLMSVLVVELFVKWMGLVVRMVWFCVDVVMEVYCGVLRRLMRVCGVLMMELVLWSWLIVVKFMESGCVGVRLVSEWLFCIFFLEIWLLLLVFRLMRVELWR